MGKPGLSNAESVRSFAEARPHRLLRRGAWLAAVLACLWLSAGCVAQHDNRFIYTRGTLPGPLIQAREAGTYELYADDALAPKFSIDLAAGDAYGFRKREDDAIVAVAKDKEIELGDRYSPFCYWLKKKAEPGK